MEKNDAWKATILLLFIYFAFGIYLIHLGLAYKMEGFFAGAAMWFILAGVVLVFVEMAIWDWGT